MKCGRGMVWGCRTGDESLVSAKLSFVVGNTWRVMYWRDTWCGDSFPSLFAITEPKEAWGECWSEPKEGEG